MKAWSVTKLGEPTEALELNEVEIPRPGPGQVLVRVLGSAANFIDVLLCRGEYQVRPDLPFTPGMEICGEVVATGSEVTRVSVGDRVLGETAVPHGGFAEYALLDETSTFPAPDSLNDAQAASLFIGYQTAWLALHRRAAIQRDETLLVHGAAGGVGSAALQLGKAAGARTVAVVGGAAKAAYAKQFGADVVVDRHTEDFVKVVQEFTGRHGADVICDPVGGDTYTRSTKCVAFEGRIVLIGFAGGDIQSAALNHTLIKNYSILGLHGGLYTAKAPEVLTTCHAELTRMADEGIVRPLVSETFGLTDVPKSLQRLADGEIVGRIVFQP
jgi:NADPH2:quinone reductase